MNEEENQKKPMTVEEILAVALDIGEHLLSCGAAVNRVEDTIARICKSYGVQKVEVFSINSLSLVSAEDENGHAVTRTKRSYASVTNLHQQELLNALSRYICTEHPSKEEIEQKRKELLSQDKDIVWLACIGYFFSTGAFSVYFGGTVRDGLAAALVSLVVYVINRRMKRRSMNQIVYTVIASAGAGMLAILLTAAGISQHVDKVMIGDVMLFVPGLVIVNSIRDMLYGDIMTGAFRLIEAILVTLAIACGMAISLIVFGGLLP